MDLVEKFEGVTWVKTVSVNDFERNRKYPILRFTINIGPALVLTIRDSLDDLARVFLLKRYIDVVIDDDIVQINTNVVSLNLVYRGVYTTTKAYLLAMQV
jgi:hypothetical protein